MSSNELSGVNKTNHRYVAMMKNSAHTEKVRNSDFSNQIRSEERGVKQSVGAGLFMFVGVFNSQDFFLSLLLCCDYSICFFLISSFHLAPNNPTTDVPSIHQKRSAMLQSTRLQSSMNNISNVAMTALKFAYVHLCTVNNINISDTKIIKKKSHLNSHKTSPR